ncbi:hypothetical protein ACPOL_5161 [Acidisarcina polymorpha]|uniref:Uncharacterized protein n=1 Tax=Acidisarcina polymorpha TaxID=2211140 RepID=A0A2Z5G6X7_9BACT|nr:hypothetical protein ACPOL_5161 [Acidisarcina polymorpha]
MANGLPYHCFEKQAQFAPETPFTMRSFIRSQTASLAAVMLYSVFPALRREPTKMYALLGIEGYGSSKT